MIRKRHYIISISLFLNGMGRCIPPGKLLTGKYFFKNLLGFLQSTEKGVNAILKRKWDELAIFMIPDLCICSHLIMNLFFLP